MIVQSLPEGAPPGTPAFVVLQHDHTRFAGVLARHFGNDEFAPVEPRDLFAALVEDHDEGWDELDALVLQDERTGLPLHLLATPVRLGIGTSSRSPEINEARHPFRGLLSSMHSYGLYTGRYGLWGPVLRELLDAEDLPAVDAMLAAEEARQERLLAQLAADPVTAPLADPALVRRAYAVLQFLDGFALHHQLEHPSRRREQAFPNVPRSADADDLVTIRCRPLGDGVFRLEPFPFDEDGLEVATAGRYLAPQPPGTDLVPLLAATEPTEQRVRLVRSAS